jgi:hypothetical protein
VRTADRIGYNASIVRTVACLVSVALLVPAGTQSVAKAAEKIEPACLAQLRIPREVRREGSSSTPIKSRPLGRKRLLFRRGGVVLVIDHAVFHSKAVAFLNKNGAERFPEETSMLRQFAKQLEKTDEADIDETKLTGASRNRLAFRLADVLEAGAFEVRDSRPTKTENGPPSTPSSGVILRIDWSYYCGQLCAGQGRIFVTKGCQELVAVTDLIS